MEPSAGRAARCHAPSGQSGEHRARGVLWYAERRAEGAVRGDRTKTNGVISGPLPEPPLDPGYWYVTTVTEAKILRLSAQRRVSPQGNPQRLTNRMLLW